jgi:hypothetical protein
MKRLIVLSVIMAVMLLAWGSVPAHAQDSAKDDKPTFYHLLPGTYVNGWPRFTVHYPKDWVERHPMPQETFRISAHGPVPSPAFVYAPGLNTPPLDKFADWIAFLFKNMAKDVTIISDKPSQLRDGTPAREFELRMLLNGAPLNMMGLVAKKGDVTINMGVDSPNGKIGEDLKAILYSIEFQPDKDKPVKVPTDVREFLDKHSSDLVARDVAKVMAHYSDRYLNSGMTKGEVERFWKQFIGSVTSYKIGITEFVAAGDQTYLVGFVTSNLGIGPLRENSIIKEDGEWKWFGNQRNPTP